MKTGIAPSVAQSYWDEAEVYPRSTNPALMLSLEQQSLLRLFGKPPESPPQGTSAPEEAAAPPSVIRPPSAKTLFDAYLMVDWSGSSRPKRGADSIWYALVVWEQDRMRLLDLQNPATRAMATREVAELLVAMAAADRSVLVGFDFPYGYPQGAAPALSREKEQPWRATWDLLAERIVDQPDNANNRFVVASGLNRAVSGQAFPFWGCPYSRETAVLTAKRGGDPGIGLPEYRMTERRVKASQPVWKLGGVGSVGSQALPGIPRVLQLRDDPRLASISRVWPFEERMDGDWSRDGRAWRISHTEIYPSIVKVSPQPGEVKDALQVTQLAEHFGRLDRDGQLPLHRRRSGRRPRAQVPATYISPSRTAEIGPTRAIGSDLDPTLLHLVPVENGVHHRVTLLPWGSCSARLRPARCDAAGRRAGLPGPGGRRCTRPASRSSVGNLGLPTRGADAGPDPP